VTSLGRCPSGTGCSPGIPHCLSSSVPSGFPPHNLRMLRGEAESPHPAGGGQQTLFDKPEDMQDASRSRRRSSALSSSRCSLHRLARVLKTIPRSRVVPQPPSYWHRPAGRQLEKHRAAFCIALVGVMTRGEAAWLDDQRIDTGPPIDDVVSELRRDGQPACKARQDMSPTLPLPYVA
jgi:hypothetical protein